MTFFSWRNWARVQRHVWRMTPRRAPGEALFRAALGAVSAAAWRRDRPAPLPDDTVLIVGHQRSGTTWLHRMLALHPAATALPLHGLLLPADTLQRPLQRLSRPPWFDRAQDRLFGALDTVHRVRLHEYEEDELGLYFLYRSPAVPMDRPWPAADAPDVDADPGVYGVYAQMIARAVRRSPARRYVGKNPHASHRVDAFRAALPGLHVVQLVRHPAEAIASRLSMLQTLWTWRDPSFVMGAEQIERVYANSVRCYLGADGKADLDVGYTELVADPVGVVERIHAAFGLEPLDDHVRAQLTDRLRSGASPHRYALADFGLSHQRLARDLAPVYDRWGFSEVP